MFILGHTGIGSRMLGPLRELLPASWVLFGCLLPDLIDKPLFYGLLWLERHPDKLITGTRSFGHTGLFLLLLALAGLISRSRPVWAVAAGVLTHLILDATGELLTGAEPDTTIWLAIFFPRFGVRFPVAHFDSLLEHLRLSGQSLYVIFGELAGGAILLRAWLHRRRGKA